MARSLSYGDAFLLGIFLGALLWFLVIDAGSAEPGPVTAIVYSAVDCPPCRRMEVAFQRAKLTVLFEEDERELDRMKINATPTTMIFVGRKCVWRRVGYISVQTMKNKLAEYSRDARK